MVPFYGIPIFYTDKLNEDDMPMTENWTESTTTIPMSPDSPWMRINVEMSGNGTTVTSTQENIDMDIKKVIEVIRRRESMEKVYCSECKYFRRDPDSSQYEQCRAFRTPIPHPVVRCYEYGIPKNINRDNDCAEYSPSMWATIKRWWKGCAE